MTCNNIILSQPEAGATTSHDIPDDVSARLNFGPQDISGLRLGGEGELVISFVDGGQLNISNFDSLVDNGNLLYLEDGTLVDPSILTSSLQTPANFNSIETAAGAATDAGAIKIAQPAAGATQEVNMQAGQKYVCDFDPSNAATVEVKNGQMVLTFADGSQVVINNYSDVMAGDLPAELTVADGTVIDGSELLTTVTEAPSEEVLTIAEAPRQPEPDAAQVANIEPAAGEDIAQQLANIEPAAGDTGATGNSGYGFNSSPVDVPLNSPDAIGPLDPTQLSYVAPQFQQDQLFVAANAPAPVDDRPVFNIDPSVVDETEITAGTANVTQDINVNFGNDGPGTIAGNGDFEATCELTAGNLTSGGVDVEVEFNPVTNTYTGTAGNETVFTMVIDPTNLEYTYTQLEPFDHSDTANDNEAICLDFGVTATDGDGSTTNGNIRVNVLDDAPVVTSQIDQTVDETNFDANGKVSTSGQFFVDAGEDDSATFAGTDSFVAKDPAGNDITATLTSGGVPVVVTYDAATSTYTGDANGTTVFTYVIDTATGEYVYTLCAPLDHTDANDTNDNISFEFGMSVTDFDGDTKTGTITINNLDDAPTIEGDTESLDETIGFPNMVDGQVMVDFGSDGAGEICGTGNFTATGAVDNGTLTSNGEPVVTTFDLATNTYTGTADGVEIYTLVLDPATGKYDFTISGPLDHADPSAPNEVIGLNFEVKATDGDGDVVTTVIKIEVADDVPSISNDSNKITEDDLATGPIVVNDTVPHDFGEDGAGEICGNDDFQAKDDENGGPINLTAGGEPVVTTFDAATNTYTGVAGGVEIYTLVIDSATGGYEFTLNETLDHTGQGADVLWLKFGVKVVDFDGDTDTAYIIVDVVDDVPVINPSSGDVDETNLADGPVEFTDELDLEDGSTVEPNGEVTPSTPLTACGVPVIVTNANGVYTGVANGVTIFTMSVDATTGEYTFTQFAALDHPDSTDPDDILSIDFGVTVTADDGDMVDTTITINVADDGPAATDDFSSAEEGQTITGDVVANDVVSQDDTTVTNVNFNGTDYPIAVGGSAVIPAEYGTLTINSDGTYSYETDNDDPDGTDVFNYTLTDCDGDEVMATLSIEVSPDGQPVAVSQELAVDETNLTPGPMIFNGDLNVDFGLDGIGSVTPKGADTFVAGGSLAGGTLTSSGVPVVVTLNGDTYTGMAGTTKIFDVTINTDGTYEFQLFDHIDHADATDPNDIITMEFGVVATDADGDMAMGTFTIYVHDDAPVAYDDGSQALMESESVTGNVVTGIGGPNATADEASEDNPTDVVLIGLTDATGAIIPGTEVSVPATGTATISGTYGTLQIAADGSYTYTANSNNPQGTDNFTYVIEDFDGDRDTAEFSFEVTRVNDVPVIVDPAAVTVDDTDLENGNNVVTGTIQVDYKGDGPGEISLDGEVTPSVTLESCGRPITTSTSGNTITGRAGGDVIFTMTVNDNGTYNFTQFEAIDHPNTLSNNESIFIDFGLIAEDVDGDTDTSTLRVNILDDGPSIEQIAQEVQEDVLANGNLVATGTVPNDFGEDGPGEITANGLFEAKFQRDGSNVTLESGGSAITVTNTDNVYTGRTADGAVAFTLQIDPATGDYTYTQMQPIDHPDATDPDDVIWLKFYVDIHDCDGDMDTGIIIIDVHDDAPVAVDDSASVSNSDNTATGNVLTNDDSGVDDSTVVVTTPGTYNGTYGTLVLAANGTYTYTRNGQTGGVDTFDYTMRDADGDTSTATLSVNVPVDKSPIQINGLGETDDSNVQGAARDEETGTINVNYQGDGPGTTTANGTFSSNTNQVNGALSSNGSPVSVTLSGATYTGRSAAGEVVFQMTINPNGTYRFLQYENLDHSNVNSDNEGMNLYFGVTATDSDGDTGTGNVRIIVRDDSPDAVNDTASISNSATRATGNVLTNDDTGADDGANVRVTTPGTYNGTYGTLVLAANGSYTYTRNGQAGGRDTFNYTMRDHDGDTDTATITINVAADNSPIQISGSGATDDTALASGPDVETGTINVNYQGDGPGVTTASNSFDTSGFNTGGSLSSEGRAVTVSLSGNTYVGSSSAGTVFTMTINANGTYRFVQYRELDHSNTSSNNEAINLDFGVTATDADGDTGTGNVRIVVRDDGPNATNDTLRVTGDRGSVNVLANDTPGQDATAEVVTRFNVGGTWYNAGQTASTSLGTIRVDANGNVLVDRPAATSSSSSSSRVETSTQTINAGTRDAYNVTTRTTVTTTTTTSSVPGGTLRITYEMRDFDGDRDTAILTNTLVPITNTSTSVTRTPIVTGNPPNNGDGFGGDGDGYCPLSIDLDGDGIELLSKEDGVFFDIDEDGIDDRTAWVDADDGILVRDINEDGIINDHGEMFGNDEIGGFEMLAQHDDNNDGVIDAQDAIWSTLAIWQDRNGDAFSQSDEFITLDELGIAAINLSVREVNVIIEGNDVTVVGDFITEDGGSYDAYDVWFDYDSGANSIAASEHPDNFIFEAIQSSAVEIRDFDTGEDTVDLSALIQGADNVTDAINDFVYISEEAGSTVISVDVDGANGPAEAVEVAKLNDVTGSTLEDLIEGGNIVI